MLKINLRKSLAIILGFVLLQFGGAALAFTIITIPQEQTTPSNTITDTLTLSTQTQSVTSAIRAHLFGARRMNKTRQTAQYGGILAANSHADTVSDLDGVTVAYNDLAAADGGSVGGGGGGNAKGLWITSAYSSLKNEFSRTSYDGNLNSLLAGFDFTQSDKYIFGVALSYESSQFNTKFNSGNESTSGFNVSPYFAVLLSETWSFDLSLGHGKFNTSQSRPVADISTIPISIVAIGSDFSSTRDFVSTNLTHVASWGNWKTTGFFGFTAAKHKQESYTESDATTVEESSKTHKQWNLGGEAAYGHGDSESYVGLNYERTPNPEKIEFASGEQPANDPDSFLLTAGWRHFGKGLAASFVISSRLGQDQVTDNGFFTTIRVDF